jgi:hypothetical protein
LNWIQIPLKKNEMMQIDEKGMEDLLLNMVLENNNLNFFKKNDTSPRFLTCE